MPCTSKFWKISNNKEKNRELVNSRDIVPKVFGKVAAFPVYLKQVVKSKYGPDIVILSGLTYITVSIATTGLILRIDTVSVSWAPTANTEKNTSLHDKLITMICKCNIGY